MPWLEDLKFPRGYQMGTHKINKENEDLVDSLWKKRQTLNINQCRLCNYRYLCGGGCVGRNMHNNTISCQKGECHNFKEILEIAIKEEFLQT